MNKNNLLIPIYEIKQEAIKIIKREHNFYKLASLEFRERLLSISYFEENVDLLINKLILIVYAAYENSIKSMLENYLEILENEKISLKLMTKKYKTLFFRERLKDISITLNEHTIYKKSHISKKLENLFDVLNFSENKSFKISENMIDTQSNLSVEVLLDMLDSLSLNEVNPDKYNELKIASKKALKPLLHYRNNIAHGNKYALLVSNTNIQTIDATNIESIINDVIKIVECVEVLVRESIDLKIYEFKD